MRLAKIDYSTLSKRNLVCLPRKKLHQHCMKVMPPAYLRTKDQRWHGETFLTKILFTHDLQMNNEIEVQQIRTSVTLAELFTKALLTITFEKMIYNIELRRLSELK